MTEPRPVIIHQPDTDTISPIVFDNPHSGYNETWLWDAFVERLLSGVPATGIPVLETEVPRTVIDVNRAIDEIDPGIFKGEYWPYPHKMTANVRNGMGLIPFLLKRKDGTLVQAFNESTQLTVQEVRNRISEYYIPYHVALTNLIRDAYQHHGTVAHFNFHSSPRQDAPANKDIIIGDLYGKSAGKPLTAFVREFMKAEGLSVGMNSPYPGGEIIRSTAAPKEGRHSLQIEIARDLYMDQSSLTYDTANGDNVRDMLTRFAVALQVFVKDQADALRAPAP